MTITQTASERIIEEVTTWPGVRAAPGRRGELSITVGRREIGHLHGSHAAHFGFPKQVWRRLLDEGRVGPHPVMRDGWASRRIESDEDVRDVIALLRLNYERAVARAPGLEAPLPKLHATTPAPLSFAPSLHVRAFLLERERGNLLVYSTPVLEADAAAIDALGGISRRYLNHGHEAMFGDAGFDAPLFVHALDKDGVAGQMDVGGTFAERHLVDDDFEVIPTPGHTPGATAYLWDSGEHRLLFTGDTLFLAGDEWKVAVLASSDPVRYVESLELIRELDFDVLVPWAARAGGPYYMPVAKDDARRRIDDLIARVKG
jgi:glyoxylase-like metal-dependent hydrolase (beta-lactamase superfamily II)